MKFIKKDITKADLSNYFINIKKQNGIEQLISETFVYDKIIDKLTEIELIDIDIEKLEFAFISVGEGYRLEKYILKCENITEYNVILKLKNEVGIAQYLYNSLLKLDNTLITHFNYNKEKSIILINNTIFFIEEKVTYFDLETKIFIEKDNDIISINLKNFYINYEIYTKYLSNRYNYDFKNGTCLLFDEKLNFIDYISYGKGFFFIKKELIIYNDKSLKSVSFSDYSLSGEKVALTVAKNNSEILFCYKKLESNIGFLKIEKNKAIELYYGAMYNIKYENIKFLYLNKNNVLEIDSSAGIYSGETLSTYFKLDNKKNELNYYLSYYNTKQEIILNLKDEKKGFKLVTVNNFSYDFLNEYVLDLNNLNVINVDKKELYIEREKYELKNPFDYNLNGKKFRTILYFDKIEREYIKKYLNSNNPFEKGILLENTKNKNEYIYIDYETKEIIPIVNFFDSVKVLNFIINKFTKDILDLSLSRVVSCYHFVTILLLVTQIEKNKQNYLNKLTKHYIKEYLNV